MMDNTLFEQNAVIASKLKNCIRSMGYTKVSFANKAGLTLCELKNLLDGVITDTSEFEYIVNRALTALNMSADELLQQADNYTLQKTHIKELCGVAKKQYSLLLDIVDLCAIYY